MNKRYKAGIFYPIMSLCELTSANFLPTRTRSGLVLFEPVQVREFSSFDDACQWSLYYLNHMYAVLKSYLAHDYKTKQLMAFTETSRNTIRDTLHMALQRFGRTDAIKDVIVLVDRLVTDCCIPLRSVYVRK